MVFVLERADTLKLKFFPVLISNLQLFLEIYPFDFKQNNFFVKEKQSD